MSSHRLTKGRSLFLVSGVDVQEEPSASVFRPLKRTPALHRFCFGRKEFKCVCDHVEGSEHSVPLRRGLRIDDGLIFRPFYPLVDLL